MTLRTFHLLFITVSILLAVFLALWSFDRHQTGGAMEYAVISGISLVAAAALVAYVAAFRRKSRYW